MYQVNFSDQSMAELNKLDILTQLQFIETISNLTSDQLARPREPLGKFTRRGKTFYRLRADEFRCYFEITGNKLFSRYILHRNTLTDFLFRAKLPLSDEQLVEQHNSFWKYLESLTKK